MSFQDKMIEIYTDGSGGQDVSAWSYHIPEFEVSRSGSGPGTNNVGELTGIIEALLYCQENRFKNVKIFSDSQYAIKSLSVWCHSWIKNNWIGSTGNPVKNLELIKKGLAAQVGMNVKFQWVKGHAGNEFNELCDQLCTEARKKYIAANK